MLGLSAFYGNKIENVDYFLKYSINDLPLSKFNSLNFAEINKLYKSYLF